MQHQLAQSVTNEPALRVFFLSSRLSPGRGRVEEAIVWFAKAKARKVLIELTQLSVFRREGIKLGGRNYGSIFADIKVPDVAASTLTYSTFHTILQSGKFCIHNFSTAVCQVSLFLRTGKLELYTKADINSDGAGPHRVFR